jgi:hypothetical protein
VSSGQPERDFLLHAATTLAALSEQSVRQGEPGLASLIDLARAEAEDILRTRLQKERTFSEFKARAVNGTAADPLES